MAVLRLITPVLLLCSQVQRRALAEWIAAEFDAVVVKESPASAQLVTAEEAGRWWRRQLGATLRTLLSGETDALSRNVLSHIFDSTAIPVDCATIARSFDVSSEHLSRVMLRTLGNACFTPKVLLDFAITSDLFVRLGIGCDWDIVGRDLRVSPRTLHRALYRTKAILGADMLDFRTLIKSIERRSWLGNRA